SSVTQGIVGWRIYYNDTGGNENVTNIMTFTITDTTAPTITIQSPSNTTYNSSTQSLNIWANATLNEAGSWCGVSLDSGSNNTLTNSTGNWNYLMSVTGGGSHNVVFYCNDTNGNMGSSSIRYFTLNTPPLWRNQGTNDTDNTILQGQGINLSAQGYDAVGLDWAWLSTNETGQWRNYTEMTSWWNSSWGKRSNITINNSANSNTLTNYQVFVNVSYDSDMNTTFKDLRFTWYNSTSQTETEIPYWIQNNVSSSYADVWIKVPSIANNSYGTVYMYYGNPSVNSTSNGTNTFVLFDDFEDGTLNPMWTVYQLTTYSETGGKWQVDDPFDSTWNVWKTGIYTSFSLSNGFHAKVNVLEWIEQAVDLGQDGISLLDASDALKASIRMGDSWDVDSGQKVAVWGTASYGGGAGTLPASGSAKIEIYSDQNNNYNLKWDGTSILSGTEAISDVSKLVLTTLQYSNYAPKKARFSDIIVRKYFLPEPTTTVGTEETPSQPKYYSSPMNMNDATSWTWSNFTWQNSSVAQGTVIGWRIYYNDTSGNENVTSLATFTIDATPPQYSLNSTNSTQVSSPVEFRLKWTDNVGLSGYIFSFDNCTSSFTNDTWQTMTGTSNWSNVTKTINSTPSCTIRWKVYANDTSNNWNTSQTYSFITTDTTLPQWSSNASSIVSSYSTAKSYFNITWTDNTNIDNALIEGNWTNPTNYSMFK
ncbi:MAG: DUF2341 domain-containing protein, partial [Thaumarchaeota archaeon]|nr:DUF2341 domain-containing protein [Nitrososphaerota archaeon]